MLSQVQLRCSSAQAASLAAARAARRAASVARSSRRGRAYGIVRAQFERRAMCRRIGQLACMLPGAHISVPSSPLLSCVLCMCMLACVLMRCKSVVVRVSLVLLGEPSPCVTGAVLWRCAVHSLHDLVMAQVCRAWRDALRGGGVGCPSPLLAHMWDVLPVLEYLDMDSLHAVRMVCRRLRVLASPCLQGARDIMVLRYRDCRCTLPCLGQ